MTDDNTNPTPAPLPDTPTAGADETRPNETAVDSVGESTSGPADTTAPDATPEQDRTVVSPEPEPAKETAQPVEPTTSDADDANEPVKSVDAPADADSPAEPLVAAAKPQSADDVSPETAAKPDEAVTDETPVESPDTAEQEAPSDASSIETATEKMTIDAVESFADFVRFVVAVDGDLKPMELKKSAPARIAIAKQAKVAEFADEIDRIAVRDVKLATPLSLMMTADRSDLTGFARQNLTELAAHTLGRHRAFAADSIFQERLSRLLPGDADDDILPRLITRLQNLLDSDFDGKSALKPPALAALRDNATHSVILIAASAAKWDSGKVIGALADEVWSAGTVFSDSATHRDKLVALPKASRKAASLIVESGRTERRALEDELGAAASRAAVSLAEVERLTAELESERRRAVELGTELEEARAELQTEVSARRSERMGATSDFEVLRVDTARTISDQIEALEDALDALGHEQPKITEEFVGRAVNNLRRSLTSLLPPTTPDSQGETA